MRSWLKRVWELEWWNRSRDTERIDISSEAFCYKRKQRVAWWLKGEVGAEEALLRWETLELVCLLIGIIWKEGNIDGSEKRGLIAESSPLKSAKDGIRGKHGGDGFVEKDNFPPWLQWKKQSKWPPMWGGCSISKDLSSPPYSYLTSWSLQASCPSSTTIVNHYV